MVTMLETLVLINQSLYCASFFPQIISNYRNKCGNALSDFYLVLIFNTYAILLYYFFCLPQPVCYRLSVAIQFLSVALLVLQRFLYHRDTWRRLMMAWYVINGLSLASLVYAVMIDPLYVGNLAGWVAFGLVLINRFPQIFYFYYTKTVQGFSPLFLVAFGAAGVMEMMVVVVYKLPIQTFFMAAAGFAAILIMAYQYQLYAKKQDGI